MPTKHVMQFVEVPPSMPGVGVGVGVGAGVSCTSATPQLGTTGLCRNNDHHHPQPAPPPPPLTCQPIVCVSPRKLGRFEVTFAARSSGSNGPCMGRRLGPFVCTACACQQQQLPKRSDSTLLLPKRSDSEKNRLHHHSRRPLSMCRWSALRTTCIMEYKLTGGVLSLSCLCLVFALS